MLFESENAYKCVFLRGSAPDPVGEAYRAPQTLSWIKEREKWRNGEGKGKREKGKCSGGAGEENAENDFVPLVEIH